MFFLLALITNTSFIAVLFESCNICHTILTYSNLKIHLTLLLIYDPIKAI